MFRFYLKRNLLKALFSDRLPSFDRRFLFFSLTFERRGGNAEWKRPMSISRIERGTQIDISEKLGNDRGGGIRATKTERSWTDFCSWPNPPQLPSRPGNTIQLLLLLHSYLRAWILVNDFALWNWEMSILLALPLIHLENYYPLIDL